MNKLVSFVWAVFVFSLSSSCVPDPSQFTLNSSSPTKPFNPVSFNDSQKFPETVALEKDLLQMHKSITASSGRVKKTKKTVKDARYAAEGAVSMIGQIRSVEGQISRLERELNSLVNIPYFKMLKPVAKGVSSLQDKVYNIRKKAEKLRDQKIKPAIKKLKKVEAKLAKLDSNLRYAASETSQARRHASLLRGFVIAQQSPPRQVKALEAASKSARYPVRPVKGALSDFDSACSDVERQAIAYQNLMKNLTRLKPGLDKVKETMAPVDKKLKAIAKVLDTRIGPKKMNLTVRKVIEAPGKVVNFVLKPAKKLLEPVTKGFKINIQAPAELKKISEQLDKINKFSFNIEGASLKFDKPANLRAIENYRSALKKFKSTSKASLTR